MSLPLNQVVVGDCVEVMRAWPADSIDLAVTSPPYWGLRDYGPETVRVWGDRPECEHEWVESESGLVHENRNFSIGSQEEVHGERETTWIRKYDSQKAGFCLKCGAWRGSLGLEPHPQMFIDHLVEIFREIKRVLKPSGTFWLNLGDTYASMKGKCYNPGGGVTSLPQDAFKELSRDQNPNRMLKSNGGWLQPKQLLGIPWRVAIALQHDGWILRNDIIWHKPNHMPSSVKDRLTNAYEHVFLLAKNRRYYFDLDAIRKPHSASTIQRITQPSVMSQRGGDKQRELRGEGGGNASRSADMVKSLARNYEEWYFVEREKKSWHDHEHDEVMGFGQQKRGFKVENLPHPKGKNPGDLWRIPTMPFPAAHFATFPSALIEPIVKAGCPRWICSKCGKPRERITEREEKTPRVGKSKKDEAKDFKGSGIHRKIGQAYQNWLNENPKITVGWSDCGCGEEWEPGVFLDPFCGSGTALRVARRLGRRFIGIDIVPEYVEMALRRIRGESYSEPPEGVAPLDILFENIREANDE